jgi:hypothetical protein
VVIDIVGSVSLESGRGPGGMSIFLRQADRDPTVLMLAHEAEEDKVLRASDGHEYDEVVNGCFDVWTGRQ